MLFSWWNWSNSGTFEEQSGTVTFNGSGAQTITAGGTGSTKVTMIF